MSSTAVTTSDAFANLTNEDKDVLRQSWSCISEWKHQLGIDIFLMICDQCPEAKPYFSWFTNYAQPVEEIANTSAFRAHASQFVRILSRVVDDLDNPGSLHALAVQLGRSHARQEHHFQIYLWSAFLECTLCQLRMIMRKYKVYGVNEQVMLDAVIMLWRSVLTAFVDELQQTYYHGKKTTTGKPSAQQQNNDDLMLTVDLRSTGKSPSSPSRGRSSAPNTPRRRANLLQKFSSTLWCSNGIDRGENSDPEANFD